MTRNMTGLPPKRDSGSKGVKGGNIYWCTRYQVHVFQYSTSIIHEATYVHTRALGLMHQIRRCPKRLIFETGGKKRFRLVDRNQGEIIRYDPSLFCFCFHAPIFSYYGGP